MHIVKRLSLPLLLILFTGIARADNAADQDQQRLKVSEAFGHFIGRNLNTPGLHFDLEMLIKGIRNGASGKPAPMSDEEYERIMAEYQTNAYNELAQKNLNDAEAFLEDNLSKEGIKEIEKGKLQFEILTEGSGKAVGPDDSALVHFSGSLVDGTLLGSTEASGGPVEISIPEAIPGFQKGIVGMKEGEKRRLFIHPDYSFEAPENIPPNALVIFEVEVVETNTSDPEIFSEEKAQLDPNKAKVFEEDFQMPEW